MQHTSRKTLGLVGGLLGSGPTCSIKIRLTAGVDVTLLNIAEIQLFVKANVQLLPLNLQVVVSSVLDLLRVGDHCLDGNLLSIFKTAVTDTNPHLIINYPCPSGNTELTRLVLVNILDELYRYRINHFTCDFYNAKGIKDCKSYVFTGAQCLYDIDVLSLKL